MKQDPAFEGNQRAWTAALAGTAGRLRPADPRDYGIIAAFIALFTTLAVASDAFLTWRNIANILDQNADVGLIACGGTLVLIVGGFDLSSGAIFALAGVTAAQAASHVVPEIALLSGVGIALGIGILNGLLVTIGRINAFIATLGMAIMVGGLAVAMTGGFLVSVRDDAFASLGRGTIGLVNYSVLVWAGFGVICGFLLSRTTFGSAVYAIGGNREAARLSGIRVNSVRVTCFAISGLAAGIAGIIVASKVSQGQADAGGFDLAFTAIAAIVIGGTSILGGEGAIWRAVIGTLLLAMINNGFNLLNVDFVYRDIFRGAIIIGAVGLDAWLRASRTGGGGRKGLLEAARHVIKPTR